MKHYRLNQIAMAVLGALLLIFGTKTLIDIAFEEHEPEKPGYEVATKQGEKAGEKPAAAAGSELPALLAKADAAKGETTAAICKACHAFEAGAPSPIGPNLHNVVGRKIASVEGFNYSPALKAHAGEVWTYEHLDAMIHKPADFAPGTLMAFPGLPDAQQRADVIAFLRTKTDNPPPLPEVVAAKEAPAEGAEAPAEGAKPAEGAAKAPGAEILPALAKADPKKGEASVALCKVCHSFDKGAPSPIGPNLYGVVGRKIASLEGFNYSPALKAKASEGDWTFEHLDLWLTNPQAFAPGTTMAFPGIPDLKTRADVIDFLRTKSDSPVPLPEAAPAAAPAPAAEEKPAEAPAAPTAEKQAEAPAAPAAEKPAEAPAAPTGEKPAEAPAAPTAEKPAEAPAAPAAEKPAEAPAAPAAEKPAEAPAAPATEEKPAEAPAPAEAAPAEAAAPAANGDFSEPSTARQPQPVVPGEEPAPASEEAPAAESAPAAGDFSEPSTARQPQPAYPDGEPQ
jgi:cytochrome c